MEGRKMESVHYKIQVNSVSYETDAPTNSQQRSNSKQIILCFCIDSRIRPRTVMLRQKQLAIHG